MKVNKDEVKEILDTLPVSYYLGRNINVVYDTDSETSYFNPIEDEIHISFTNIYDACTAMPDNIDSAKMSLESLVRTILYHEVSHTILTPLAFTAPNNKYYKWDDVMNVIEDERIETILKDYYHDVNFETFKRLATHYDPHNLITTPDQLFYVVVRFHDGPVELVRQSIEIIRQNLELVSTTLLHNIISYYAKAHDLYNECKKYFEDHKDELNKNLPQSQSSQSQSSQSQESQSQESQNIQSQVQLQDESTQTSQSQTENSQIKVESNIEGNNSDSSSNTSHDNTRFVWTEDEEDDVKRDELHIEDMVKNYDGIAPETILKNSIDKYQNDTLKTQFDQIFRSYKQHQNSKASAIPSYSGVFNPRLAGRDDYKMWTTKNPEGNIKDYSKIKLNLFIDNSGSMERNADQVNMLLYNLYRLEKKCKQFNFDVVLLGGNDVIRKLDHQYEIYTTNGETWVSHKIFDIAKSVQDPTSNNINIVMFDGDAFNMYSYKYAKEAKKNFGAFNNSSYTLIIEDENYATAKKYCPKAKIINTPNYFNTFMNEILKTLMQKLK